MTNINEEGLKALVAEYMPGKMAGAEIKLTLRVVNDVYIWVATVFSPGVYGNTERVLVHHPELKELLESLETVIATAKSKMVVPENPEAPVVGIGTTESVEVIDGNAPKEEVKEEEVAEDIVIEEVEVAEAPAKKTSKK